jgi:ribonuclease D
LKVRLDHNETFSDWSRRPLKETQMLYGADDVRYLTALGRMVRQSCRDADVLEEVELDCARMCAEAQVRPDILQTELKLPKQGLNPKQIALAQAVARRLHVLRLALAEKANRPNAKAMLEKAAEAELAQRAAYRSRRKSMSRELP